MSIISVIVAINQKVCIQIALIATGNNDLTTKEEDLTFLTSTRLNMYMNVIGCFPIDPSIDI